jgi:hypothetical protein
MAKQQLHAATTQPLQHTSSRVGVGVAWKFARLLQQNVATRRQLRVAPKASCLLTSCTDGSCRFR